MTWLCGLLLVLLGATRQLVLCTHEDGSAHVVFAHDEGDCCRDHDHFEAGADHDLGGGDDDHESCAWNPTCSHVDLAVEVAPGPAPDPAPPLPTLAFEPLSTAALGVRLPRANRRHAPLANGPPGHRAWLRLRQRLHQSVLLLI